MFCHRVVRAAVFVAAVIAISSRGFVATAAADDKLLAACSEFLASDAPSMSVVAEIESFSGDIDAVIRRLAADVPSDYADVSGVLANQSFTHPHLRTSCSDDRLHFFVPDGYEANKPFGLIIFMHGGGPTTPRDHPLHVVTHPDDDPAGIGLQPHIAELPFILVAPSAPWNESTGARWNVSEADAYIRAVIEECCYRFNIDRDRIVLGGYSMGGFGAYHLCQRLNDRLAGGFVFSGSWKTMHWRAWTGLPLFLRHGVHDASPPDENGRGGRPRFTDVFYSRTAVDRLKQLGMNPAYVEDDGDHAIRPAVNAMRQLAAWIEPLRRERYPRHVVAVSPRGWRASSDTATPHSHWVTIHEVGDGAIEVDRVIREGPAPAFRETAEDFHKQSLHVTTMPVKAGLVEAKFLSDNRIDIVTENVRRFSLWFHPQLADFNRPLTVCVNGVASTHAIRPQLIHALRSCRRSEDRTRIYHSELTITCEDESRRSEKPE